jgi:hypothetical protein
VPSTDDVLLHQDGLERFWHRCSGPSALSDAAARF